MRYATFGDGCGRAARSAARPQAHRPTIRAGVGLLALLLVGCGKKPPNSAGGPGAAGGGGASADGSPPGPVRPQRDLPKQLFAYWPNDQYTIAFSDFTAADSDPPPAPYFPSGLDKTLGITAAQVSQSIHFSNFSRSAAPVEVYLYALKTPLDLPAVAAAAKFTTAAAGGGTVYYPPGPVQQSQVLQPAPGVLLILHRPTSFGKDTKLAADLLRRGPTDTPIPAGLWDAMKEVSGYPQISAATGHRNDDVGTGIPKFRASGSVRTPTHNETLRYLVFPSDAAAKSGGDAERQLDAKNPSPPPGREVRQWVRGDRLYRLVKDPKK